MWDIVSFHEKISPLILSTTNASKLKVARKQKKIKIKYVDVDREEDSSSGEVDSRPLIGSSCALNKRKGERDKKKIFFTCVDMVKMSFPVGRVIVIINLLLLVLQL